MALKSTAYLRRLLPLLVAVAFLLAALAACHRAPDARLALADSLMESRPDSALAVLDSILSASLSSASDRALHALLLTQARHKNYIDETSDSLISTAVDYFSAHHVDSLLMRALYYHGVIQFNSADYEGALNSASKSLLSAQQLSSFLWTARAYDLIADILYAGYNMGEAINYRKKAIQSFEYLGRDGNVLSSKLDLVAALSSNHQPLEAIALADSLKALAINAGDSVFAAECIRLTINPYLEVCKYTEASRAFADLEIYAHICPPSVRTLISKAKLQMRFSPADGKLLLDSIATLVEDPQARIEYFDALRDFYAVTGNYEGHAMASDSLFYIQGRVAQLNLTRPLTATQRRFYEEQNKFADLIIRHKQFTIYFVILLAVLIGCLISAIYIWRLRKKRNEIQSQVETIQNLTLRLKNSLDAAEKLDKVKKEKQEMADLQRSLSDRLKSEIEKSSLLLTRNKLLENENTSLAIMNQKVILHSVESINILCNRFCDQSELKDQQAHTFEKIRKDYGEFISTYTLDDFVEWIDTGKDRIVSQLAERIPSLTQDDIYLFAFTAANFSIKTISYLTGIKSKTLYFRRNKLKELIIDRLGAEGNRFADLIF